jgi:hypothetical protein
MTDRSFNEEDLKARILLPYLSALGLSPNQIELEKTLRVKLGRNAIERNTARDFKVTGRLDVLVRSLTGQNLFIVELKRPDADLTEEDRDQGISYARLLDQIAPFVLVTNGRSAALYDTITKAPLNESEFPRHSQFWINGCSLADPKSLQIRYEALKYFIGYSPENIRDFSISQQSRWLEPLRGNATKLDRKYIPEVYVTRPVVRDAVDAFLTGSGAAFAIVGESGIGKTNEMCALAERLSLDRIVIFIAGAAVAAGLGDTLLEEFNWHFSDQVTEVELIRRLAEFARLTNKSVVVIVDALDEVTVPRFEQSVAAFARHLRDFSGQVKLIVSAKSAEWHRFAQFRGTPSPLALALDATWRMSSGSPEEPAPMVLTLFSEKELQGAEAKYGEIFHLRGTPKGRMRHHCLLPFFLRVASDTYAGRQEGMPEDISANDLVQSWLDRKYSSMAAPDRARLELLAVARAFWKRATTTQDSDRTMADRQSIPESNILDEMGSQTTPFGNELVSHGLLNRRADEHGRISFSFYYGRVRDYVIARQVLRLDQLNAADFAKLVDRLLLDPTLQSVLAWHLREAPASHLDELKKSLRGRAAVFLTIYEQLFDQVLPGLKKGVEPFTASAIGFAYEVAAYGPRSFGLYALEEDRQRITVVEPVEVDPSLAPFSRELRKVTRYARAGGRNFSNSDPEMAAAEFAYERIQEAIEEGRLDDMLSNELVIEAALALTVAYRDRLWLGPNRVVSPFQPSMYPIDVQSIERAIQTYFGKEHYRRQWVEENTAVQLEARKRRATNNPTLDGRAMEEIERRVQLEVEQGAHFPLPRLINETEFYQLVTLVERLQALNVTEIASPPLPLADLTLSYRRWIFNRVFR